jgi:hypothetical protein
MKKGPVIAISSLFIIIASTVWYSVFRSKESEPVQVIGKENPQLDHEDVNLGQ